MPLALAPAASFSSEATTEPLPQRPHWAPSLFMLEGELAATAGLKQRWPFHGLRVARKDMCCENELGPSAQIVK